MFPALRRHIPDWKEGRVELLYLSVAGFEDGLERVRSQLGNESVLCATTLSDEDQAFHPEAGIYQTAEERIAARELAGEVGAVLEKHHPLGWEGSQALVVFPDWAPNNSLPILWKEGRSYKGRLWTPLFPRG